MNALRRHWLRIAITLLPVLLALGHAVGVWRSPFVEPFDNFIYDTRLRLTMPRTLDPRIVIVDIDDPSLQQLGQWPWSRDKLARLTEEIVGRQQAAVLGYDVLFVEADGSSGLASLQQLAAGPLRDDAAFAAQLQRLAPTLDHDTLFAKSLVDRRVSLGYYFTLTPQARAKGRLPVPLLPPDTFPAGPHYATRWNGFAGSIAPLAEAAPAGGFINVLIESTGDGVVRAAPLMARYEGVAATPGYYESLALAVYRLAQGRPPVRAAFAPSGLPGRPALLEALLLDTPGQGLLRVPVDQSASLLVPFRGPGGVRGGSFRYIAAADVFNGKLAPGELKDKIVLVGATAPGLQDLRATPVGAAFPGVEVHANIISGLIDRRLPYVPDYAPGYGVLVLLISGLLLAVGMSLLPASRAALLCIGVGVLVVGLNAALFASFGLVLPLAVALMMIAMAFVLNMSWGYFVEARARRGLARLFGTYVPPQLVDEMLERPERYSMRAESKELTVMFCDMRGFTQLSETMAPTELQAFLNTVFSRLTEIINAHRGTVDKYMGDCVMAFWGAPVHTADHATLAVQAATEMVAAVQEINLVHRADGRPEINVGIGLNTGVMSVGDMGSAVRRSYTVVGDAVNLAARLESLSGHYGAEILATDATRQAASRYLWQELDLVYVRGKARAVAVFTPVARVDEAGPALLAQLERWDLVLSAYRAQQWAEGRTLLAPLLTVDAKKVLYQLYAKRLASMALQPKDPDWDGAIRFETK
ncbi:CHASE2 domain-containing protein [Variovorax guangxiensis]|uniref:Adenylate/guanylate cyclase domain-containing protein n=1 Tax=Variovorax guangxiensis TaxID=1775474 RepID=A0A502DUP7_9BURK|nr:adenylate/guanylate cyclase domain-containing protein [Variovorax guangxiensis]TPG24814.1 adenylate/guanylate cyclase domain-containing protein [Variovorax ginsengisoli]TPG29067.1 adenylate/guanylate cyclase domain-containing protein [Variovorax guangxiensis]